jgi:hypothetical protein
MPVPTTIADLATVAGDNSPTGTESAFPNADNYLRAAFAFIAQLQDQIDALTLGSGFAPLAGAQFTGSIGTTPVTLTDAATITPDASVSNSFAVTLGGNRTLANPTGLKDGGTYHFLIRQDATGGRTLAFGSFFKGAPPALVATPNSMTLVTAHYNAAIPALLCTYVGGLL